jgi:hypothetical protein
MMECNKNNNNSRVFTGLLYLTIGEVLVEGGGNYPRRDEVDGTLLIDAG